VSLPRAWGEGLEHGAAGPRAVLLAGAPKNTIDSLELMEHAMTWRKSDPSSDWSRVLWLLVAGKDAKPLSGGCPHAGFLFIRTPLGKISFHCCHAGLDSWA
jgi:hypothetical protein